MSSVLVTHYELLVTHYVAQVTHYVVLVTHYVVLVTHYVVLVTHSAVLVTHYVVTLVSSYHCRNNYNDVPSGAVSLRGVDCESVGMGHSNYNDTAIQLQ